MKIEKNLKYATFIYDEDSKEFTIQTTPKGKPESGHASDGNSIVLNKIYAFAFMRFVVRMAQKNWLRPKKTSKLKVIEGAEENFNHPDQMEIRL